MNIHLFAQQPYPIDMGDFTKQPDASLDAKIWIKEARKKGYSNRQIKKALKEKGMNYSSKYTKKGYLWLVVLVVVLVGVFVLWSMSFDTGKKSMATERNVNVGEEVVDGKIKDVITPVVGVKNTFLVTLEDGSTAIYKEGKIYSMEDIK